MKKIITFFLVSIFLISCSSDNDSTSNSDSIVGKWQVVKYSIPDYYEPCDYLGWTNILSNGKFEDYDQCSNSKSSGTWSQKDNLLTLIASDIPIPFTAKIISLSKTTLVLEFDDFGVKETITFKRI